MVMHIRIKHRTTGLLKILLLLAIAVMNNKAIASQVDIGIFEAAAPNRIDVKIRPDFTINSNLTITNIIYTIRWEDPTINISLINVAPYNMIPYQSPVFDGGFYYQRFYSFPNNPVGTTILPGEERLISSFTYTGGPNAYFEIIVNSWTQSNGGNYYLELQGSNRTGVIYQPIAPVGDLNINCPSNITLNNASGLCGRYVNYNLPTSNNPNATITQIGGLPSGSLFPVGTTVNTFQANDGENVVVCSFTVTINDTQPPTLPANGSATVQCVSAITTPSPPNGTDNCSGTISPVLHSVVNTPNPITCQGTRVYTYRYTDGAGNQSFWTYTYNVVRSTPPSQAGGPVPTSGGTVECPSQASPPTSLPVVQDVCGNTLSPPTPTIGGTYEGCEGTYTYNYTYTDCAGLQYLWVYTYNINRTTPPTQEGGPVATFATVECVSGAVPPSDLPLVKDVCGNVLNAPLPTITDSPDPLSCEGTRTYTYNYMDCKGLTYEWTFTYTIVRSTEPTQSGGPVPVSETVECLSDAIEPRNLPVVTDVCGNVLSAPEPIITDDPDPFTCEGIRTYSYTYEDCAGLTYDWSFTYTIAYSSPPAEIGPTVPTSTTLQCVSEAGPPSTLPTVADVCGNILAAPAPSVIDVPDPISCEGSRIYTYTYEDCAGQEFIWIFTVNIERTDPPVEAGGPVPASGGVVECVTEALPPTVFPMVQDACGNTLEPSGPEMTGTYAGCEGTYNYTYTYTDCAGLELEWIYSYTISRNTPPAVTGDPVPTSGGEIECISEAVPPAQLPQVVDVCGTALIAGEPETGGTYDGCEGTYTYTYIFSDCAGLEFTWTYTYDIVRSTMPLIVGTLPPTEATVECAADAIPPQLLPEVVDACGAILEAPEPLVTDMPDPVSCAGIRTYTYTFSDCVGNVVEWAFTYTINRFSPPHESGGPVPFAGDVECVSDALPPAVLPVVTDVCGNVLPAPDPTISDDPDPIECNGTRVYSYLYTDCAGFTYEWSYTYTIERITAPSEFGGPVPNSDGDINCVEEATAPAILPLVHDACGNTLSPVSMETGGSYDGCEGSYTYTYYYNDCSGLEFQWTYSYNIVRSNAPGETAGPVPTSAVVECASEAVAPASLPVVVDACFNQLSTPEPLITDEPSPLLCSGTRTFTYLYQDCAGLSFEWNFVYAIEDTQPPVISCPQDISQLTDPGSSFATIEIIPATAEDNCGEVLVAGNRSDGLELNDPYPIGITLITWTATDLCGNADQCVQTINILSPEEVFITIGDDMVIEGETAVFTVTLHGDAPGGFTVDFATANNTAIAPADYTVAAGTLSFNGTDGESHTINVNTIDDNLVEPTETFFVNLSNLDYGGANLIIADGQGVGSILDNDAATLSINDVTVNESDGEAVFEVALSNEVQNNFSVGYATANNTAIAPGDYNATNGTLSFGGAHSAIQHISVVINDDELVEQVETFYMNLIDLLPAGQNVTLDKFQGIGTIIDNDTAYLSINDVTVLESEGPAVFTINLSKSVQNLFIVGAATQNNTAIAPGDYITVNSILTFGGNNPLNRNISIPIVNDTIVEPTETFFVNLVNLQANGQNIFLDKVQGVGTIIDDDAATLSINDVTVNESDGIAVFTVSLSKVVQNIFTVDYATEDHTATAPEDYLHKNGTFTFGGSNPRTQNIPVTIVDDDIPEPTETFYINLFNLQTNQQGVLIEKEQGVGTILDDDEELPEIIPGDANCDGTVNVLDVITIINRILELDPSPFCFQEADINEDGIIDILDAIGVINLILSSGK